MGASAIPTLTGGFNLHADWKGVYMDVNAVWFAEHKIMNSYSGDFYSDDARLFQSGRGVDGMYGKTWQGMDDNKAQFPILSTDNSHTGGIASDSDQYLRRGDFIRLRADPWLQFQQVATNTSTLYGDDRCLCTGNQSVHLQI